ncbi:hypothetical protein FV232_06960 [Methylobacterium sp. WL30]|uniref:hypothetical protein n=1 Tax=unclassified Methylobacterium TaxID=2615210 RepID=UPI0011CA97D4|nr:MULTISPECIES: hypothetical protein [unclassified Methylobacterium]TXN40439.1 hypothetical protein FV225_06145 [Methylobacterium sp. WL93]TXN49148.1 hypothetical protein FV227_17870 [Methylobacterium sp. WL119]TXN68971.1 hypothetical protein FV232_06960 [Methylobacterium sp. WL30]
MHPWMSDGSPEQEWAVAQFEAVRAFEAISDRSELLALAEAAHRGPLELARRMRQTEYATGPDAEPGMNLAEFWGHLYGEDSDLNASYPAAYAYSFQAVAPYLALLH